MEHDSTRRKWLETAKKRNEAALRTSLQQFDYRLVNEPLHGLLRNLDSELQRVGEQAEAADNHARLRCSTLSLVVVRFVQNSLDAVLYLSANHPEESQRKPAFILVAPTVNRQLLDLLFSLVYMMDDFEGRALAYQRAGWREAKEEYQKLYTRFARDPEFREYLKGLHEVLQQRRTFYEITDEDEACLTRVSYWPTPTQLMNRKTESRPFLRWLNTWLYKDTSAQAHLSFGGLFQMAPILLANTLGGHHQAAIQERFLPAFHFQQVSRTSILTLAIATEIDVYFRLNNCERSAYVWGIFNGYSVEAKEMFQHRYEKLLNSCVRNC